MDCICSKNSAEGSSLSFIILLGNTKFVPWTSSAEMFLPSLGSRSDAQQNPRQDGPAGRPVLEF
jgi:hypothetical protein